MGNNGDDQRALVSHLTLRRVVGILGVILLFWRDRQLTNFASCRNHA